MALNLTKHYGPMTGTEAKRYIRDSSDTLYVIAIATQYGPYHSEEWDAEYDLITQSGAVLHGFLQTHDAILAITVWKD